jgi:hypothetical protein
MLDDQPLPDYYSMMWNYADSQQKQDSANGYKSDQMNYDDEEDGYVINSFWNNSFVRFTTDEYKQASQQTNSQHMEKTPTQILRQQQQTKSYSNSK